MQCQVLFVIIKLMGYIKSEYKKKFRHDRKLFLIDVLGGVCIECGTDHKLHFDHVIPEEKEFHISSNLDYGLDKILVELQKCQLLCKSCHTQKTITDKGHNVASHGGMSMYTNQRCRCSKCKSAWAEYSLKYTHAYRARQLILSMI